MNRLKLLVASCVVAAISGCSFSVAHRGEDGCGETGFAQDGCGEPGLFNSHNKCANCRKKSKRVGRTAPLFHGDSYGQFAGSMDCGCGEPFMSGMAGMSYPAQGTEMYFDGGSGCSTCGGGMSADMMSSGGCGSQGGAINPQYLTPQNAAPALTPAPAPAPAYRGGEPAQAPPAAQDSGATPMPAPMNEPVPAPFDAPKGDEFGADPAGAPPADTPADPVSWQVPVPMR